MFAVMTILLTGACAVSLSRRVFVGAAALSVTALAWPRPAAAQRGAGAEKAAAPLALEARPALAPLRGAEQAETPVWAYNGTVPGPALRIRRGQELRLRFTNGLPEPTLIHWHGVRAPEGVDGVPHLTEQPLAPGGVREIAFTPPDAGTFWYHAHPVFAGQSERGLYGALIVDEPEPPPVDQDLSLILDDWPLKGDGTIAAAGGGAAPHLTVNGKPGFDLPVRANERLRVRIVNASSTGIFGLKIDNHRPVVMAIDGQPAEPFAARDGRVALAPGNRVDLFVDATRAAGSRAALLLDAGGPPVPIAYLIYDPGAPARPQPLPPSKPLPANGLPERMDFARALRVGLSIGGSAASAPERKSARPQAPAAATVNWLDPEAVTQAAPLFTVARGRPVVLALANSTPEVQLFHLHNQPFRLLDALDDGWKPFWLDTSPVQPGQTARIAFVPEAAGKRMLHTRPLARAEPAAFSWYAVS